MNDEERGRKREKNIKKRRKARVSIVVDFLNSHSACFLLLNENTCTVEPRYDEALYN